MINDTLAAWWPAEKIVMAEARRAWSNPIYAASAGYVVTPRYVEPIGRSIFGEDVHLDMRTAILRAVAQKLLPSRFDWEVVETLDEEPSLILLKDSGK
jgi:hypothetical protein